MFAPGEAPTGMHCYIPKYKTLHVADNCYMCLHNVYTIRGAFPRDAMQWSDSVARSLLFEDTEYLISGHNWPVFGKKEIFTVYILKDIPQKSGTINFLMKQKNIMFNALPQFLMKMILNF